MKKAIWIMAAAILVCSLCACQATPEAPIVIGKGNSELERIIAATPVPTQEYAADEYWQESFTSKDGNVHITVDAGVMLPDTDHYPVVKVVPTHFSEDEVKRIVDVLFGDQTLYVYEGGYEDKETLMREIIECREAIEKDKAMLNEPDVNIEVIKECIASNEEWLKGLEEQYRNLPENVSFQEAECKYALDDMGVYSIGIRNGDSSPAIFFASYSESQKLSAIAYRNWGNRVYSVGAVLDEQDELHAAITKAQAVVEKALADMGIEEMRIAAICSARGTTKKQSEQERIDAEKAVQNNADIPTADPDPSSNVCYAFYLTRNVCGLDVSYVPDYDGVQALGIDGETYREPWTPEFMEIFVNDSGIIEFNWYAPAKAEEVLNENVALKPFEEIKEVGRNLLAIKFSEKDEASRKNIVIEDVMLGIMRIARENDDSEYLYVPVWDFMGHYEGSNREISFLTVNAVDGTIIDRTLGY